MGGRSQTSFLNARETLHMTHSILTDKVKHGDSFLNHAEPHQDYAMHVAGKEIMIWDSEGDVKGCV